MKSIKFVLLLIAALALSISGCKKDNSPPPSGGGGGGGSSSDCCVCDYEGLFEYPACEDDFTASEWSQFLEDNDCDCSANTAGYICDGGCFGVTNDAEFSSQSACEDDCGGSSGGFNCVSGDCQFVSSGAEFDTLSDCQALCAGGSSDCCDCFGDLYCDGEFDMGGEPWSYWEFVFESNGCDCN